MTTGRSFARRIARRIVTSTDLDEKLEPLPRRCADELAADDAPAERIDAPGRPPGLEIRPGREVKIPPLEGYHDPLQRARILHALANHELQAAELFAWALLAFPDAPVDFRRGLLAVLDDEQRHTRMYTARIEAAGYGFGDFPVTGYFWHKTPEIRSPLDFVCAMSLTWENANLDHTVQYAAVAREAGDEKTARVIEAVGRDEIEHVRFGWAWLQRFKGDDGAWETYRRSLSWPLRPSKARGQTFQTERRRRAGLDEDFIRRLEQSEPADG